MWISIAGWTLVHFVWQGGAIAVMAAGGLQLLRTATSNARYVVASVALGTMLLSPIITAQILSTSVLNTAVTATPRSASSQVLATSPVARSGFAPAVRGVHLPIVRVELESLLPIVVAMWLTGVALLLLRLTGGWWRVRGLHRAALALAASPWHAVAAPLAKRLGLRRVLHVVESPRVATPTVVGWWRPVILLPVAALTNLTPGQVEAILAHELAHIHRHDYLVNLLQHITETLLFYHPAVWWISGRMRVEREQCCDAVAVRVCGDAVGYAAALAQLEKGRSRVALAVAATSGSLVERIRYLLSAREPDQRPFAHAVMTATVVVLLIAIVGGGYRWPLTTLGAGGLAAQSAEISRARANAVAVTVNGEPITDDDLERRRRFKRDAPDAPVSQVLVDTVDERLVEQRGKQLGYALTDEQFRSVVQNLKTQNNLETDAQLQDALATQQLTVADLRLNIERQMIVSRMQLVEVFSRVVVTNEEARRYFEAHLDDFPLQTLEQAREAVNERVAAANRQRDWDRYLRALRTSAVIAWMRADLQRAYEEGLSSK